MERAQAISSGQASSRPPVMTNSKASKAQDMSALKHFARFLARCHPNLLFATTMTVTDVETHEFAHFLAHETSLSPASAAVCVNSIRRQLQEPTCTNIFGKHPACHRQLRAVALRRFAIQAKQRVGQVATLPTNCTEQGTSPAPRCSETSVQDSLDAISARLQNVVTELVAIQKSVKDVQRRVHQQEAEAHVVVPREPSGGVRSRSWPDSLSTLANLPLSSLMYQFWAEDLDSVPLHRKNHMQRDARQAFRIGLKFVDRVPVPFKSLSTDEEKEQWRTSTRHTANLVQQKVLEYLEQLTADHEPRTRKRKRTGAVTGIVRAWAKTPKASDLH